MRLHLVDRISLKMDWFYLIEIIQYYLSTFSLVNYNLVSLDKKKHIGGIKK